MRTHLILKESSYPLLATHLLPLLRVGDVICLRGDLGAGKTALARHFIRAALGFDVEVPSPTFTLVQTYDEAKPVPIWHFDLYRIKQPDEIFELGWEDVRSRGLALVEWPERLGSFLPADRLEIHLASVIGDDNLRHVTFSPCGNWVDRWPEFATLTAIQQY